MAELTKLQLQALQFNTEVATASAVSDFVNASTTELSSSLIARIQALEGFSTFIGVKDALPESAENGQIVIVGEKEYIWGPKADGVAGWTELGDTTAEATSITELSGKFENYVSSNDEAIADLTTTLSSKIDAFYNEAVLYTDHEISVLRDNTNSEISALKSVKADLSVVEEMLDNYSRDHVSYIDNEISAVRADVNYITGELDNKISTEIAYLDAKKADVSAVNASVEALTKALDDVEASLSGYDTVGSAAAALTSAKAYVDEQDTKLYSEVANRIGETAHSLSTDYINRINTTTSTFVEGINTVKAYTDEQIAAVEGEISSLTDVVETKADQTAVDAAISAINENISTLSAKAEEDPVFTAWKDGERITLGSGSFASEEYAPQSITIGYNSTSSGERNITVGSEAYGNSGNDTITIGTSATASGDRSIVIGLDAGVDPSNLPVAPDSIAIGSNARVWSEGSIAIGTYTTAGAQNSVQLGFGENSVANSFQFRSTQIVDGDGFITTANLAGIDTLKTAVSAIEEVKAEDNVQVLREAVNTLVAAIKTFVGA